MNPYGVYDVAADTGWVSVGTDHDTSAFAVNTIRSWWTTTGRDGYPGAARLMITADGGGSNGYRTRLWKTELALLAAEDRASHHGVPPATRDVEVEQDRAPALLPDLDQLAWPPPDQPSGDREHDRRDHHRVRGAGHAILDTGEYPAGLKITDKQIRELESSSTPRPARLARRVELHPHPDTQQLIHSQPLCRWHRQRTSLRGSPDPDTGLAARRRRHPRCWGRPLPSRYTPQRGCHRSGIVADRHPITTATPP